MKPDMVEQLKPESGLSAIYLILPNLDVVKARM